MWCELHRRVYAAREIYRQITNPQAAPNNTDLRHMRTKLGLTITTAARELGQWPSKISLLERGLVRNDQLAMAYRQWLTSQQTQNHDLPAVPIADEAESSLVPSLSPLPSVV
ncbi:hypothetical protein [Arthrobacter sp. ISL-28]|uniref:hypothetical protein n=1 Tax=Arthrobacter sp. ISL-28 TaxID=2819108 RepID=UPI001BE9A425|nr:hypothetical protein [Arthrobacter sp. ISL-28]